MSDPLQQSDPLTQACKRLGIKSLRPEQSEALGAVLQGTDTLAVLPTGFGKSAIYQVAADLIPGPTVVISPLIALQRDQARKLRGLDFGEAAVVNSTVAGAAQEETFEDFEEGDLQFIFLAPEQLHKEEVLAHLEEAHPSLFVVDEAHCISEWGHDFRPSYLRLNAAVKYLGHPTVLALTATASEPVREEIVKRLRMRDPRIIVGGMDRPNIFLNVVHARTLARKQRELISHIRRAKKPGIVYVSTRRAGETLTQALAEEGIHCGLYHGGMSKADRRQAQENFMQDRMPVMVATSAFGMGVDKANVRFVFHSDLSDSLDSYYQEVGRAGRDGMPAQATLFYHPKDANLHKFFAGGGKLSESEILSVMRIVQEAQQLHEDAVRKSTGLSRIKLAKLITQLEDLAFLRAHVNGELRALNEEKDFDDLIRSIQQGQTEHHRHLLVRLEQMRAYAEIRDCRRAYLLSHFGENVEPCGFCDNCKSGVPQEPPETSGRPFPVKTQVCHEEWGKGVILRYEGDSLVVLFDNAGEKLLVTQFVVEHGLLTPA